MTRANKNRILDAIHRNIITGESFEQIVDYFAYSESAIKAIRATYKRITDICISVDEAEAVVKGNYSYTRNTLLYAMRYIYKGCKEVKGVDFAKAIGVHYHDIKTKLHGLTALGLATYSDTHDLDKLIIH